MDVVKELIWYAVIGLAAGWAAAYVLKIKGNPLYLMIVGIIGAIIGGFIMHIFAFALHLAGTLFSAVVGAVLVIMALRYLQGKSVL